MADRVRNKPLPAGAETFEPNRVSTMQCPSCKQGIKALVRRAPGAPICLNCSDKNCKLHGKVYGTTLLQCVCGLACYVHWTKDGRFWLEAYAKKVPAQRKSGLRIATPEELRAIGLGRFARG